MARLPTNLSNQPPTTKSSRAVWSRVLARLFMTDAPPRWVILLAGSRILLLDRHTFAYGKYLAVDLDDAFSRREPSASLTAAALLAAETLCPDSGTVLHDTLEAQSHLFKYGVTKKLQAAVRQRPSSCSPTNGSTTGADRTCPTCGLRPDEALPGGGTEITAHPCTTNRSCSSTGCCSSCMPNRTAVTWAFSR